MLNNSLLNLGSPPPVVRGISNVVTRPRIGHEKYYRTQVEYIDSAGNKYPSKYCCVHSYELNGTTLKVCNVNIVYPHAFKKFVHSGNNYSLTDDYIVVDLATGATLDDWIYDKVSQQLTQIRVVNEDCLQEDVCCYCKKTPSAYCRNMECVQINAPFEGDL